MNAKRPNVLLFFTDQQRFDTIGALGNPVIRTPNLDRLVRSGVAFTSAYTPSPVCVSARCSMIYGQYPARTGCYDNAYNMPTDQRKTFMGMLTEAGYRTHGVGKCHFRPDWQALRGFETRDYMEEGMPNREDGGYLEFLQEEGFSYVTDVHGVRGEMYYVPQPSALPPEIHPTNWVGDRSVEFIEREAEHEQPWFPSSSFIHPHPPFTPPQPWHKLYRAPLMPLPKVPQDSEALYTWVNWHQNRYKYRDQGIDHNLMRNIKAYYYACISFVDFQIGRVLDALERTNQSDTTLILFTSDHGEHLGDYNCFGKRSMHDSCARIPMVAHLPGRFDGGVPCRAPASLVDIMPTVLAAVDIEPTHVPDGVDLADLCIGKAPRDAVFSQFEQNQRAIYTAVTERWKYTYSAGDDREFLFDRVQDPDETRNRAGLTFVRDELSAMRDIALEYAREGGEHDALDGDTWKRYPHIEQPNDPDTGLFVQDPAWADTSIPGYTDD